MLVAVDRVAGFFVCLFVFVFVFFFELVGCGFEHVKSLVLSSAVIESLQLIMV